MLKLKFFSLLLLITTILSPVAADPPRKTRVNSYKHALIINTCSRYINNKFKFAYNGTKAKGRNAKMCKYEPQLASTLICSAEKFGAYSKVFNKSLHYTQTLCKEYEERTFEEILEIYENGTQYALPYDPHTTNYTKTKLTYPIIINATTIYPQYRYMQNMYYNLDEISFFAGFFYLYFVLVFVLFGVTSLCQRLGLHTKFNNKVINWYRSNISIPTLFRNGRHTENFSILKFKLISALIPTRVESVVIFFYTCINVFLGTYNYDTSYHGSFTKAMFTWRIIADRTGLLAFGQIPLLIIFAGRNNILTTLTGIPYTSMIVYHKCVARFMYLHAVIHSVAWTAYGVLNGSLTRSYHKIYYRWGIVATVAAGIILIQAFHYLRTASYETFLVIHIVLVAVFIAACFHHCYTLGWLEWIYVSWAVWIFDRLIRVIRMFMNGLQKAEVQYVGDDTFRVEVPHNRWFNPFPGSYAFLYFMTPSLFWQSHPFTLLKSVNKQNHICFYIKAKTGLTRRIINQLHTEPNGTKTIRVCIEGPYGHRAPTNRYDKALILAGGNGVPGPFAHVLDLASRESINKQQVKFLWTIRNIESLNWFYDELKVMAALKQVDMDIYITGKNQGQIQPEIQEEKVQHEKAKSGEGHETEIEKESSTSEPSSDSEKYFTSEQRAKDIIQTLSGRVTFHYGRPDLDKMIIEEFSDENGPSVCVMTCGPPKMVDQVRNSVANHLSSSKGRVDLFEELQTW